MAKRKTISIQKLVELVNEANKNSTCAFGVREGWNHLLTIVLSETGNYRGFRYLEQGEVPEGRAPGIRISPDGPGFHEFPDETRREYHYSAV